MNYLLIILILLLPACTIQTSNTNDLGLQIDIYKKDMTFEKFKEIVIDYADKATYPDITKK